MEKNPSAVWGEFFANWPRDMKRKGVIVSSYNEQIPFDDFLLSSNIIIAQRPAPDAVGGRRVVLPLSSILAVKFTDPIKTEVLTAAGYRPSGKATGGTQGPAKPSSQG